MEIQSCENGFNLHKFSIFQSLNAGKLRMFRAHIPKMLQFCKVTPEVLENFTFVLLKYRKSAQQNGRAEGGGVAPDPPLRVNEINFGK